MKKLLGRFSKKSAQDEKDSIPAAEQPGLFTTITSAELLDQKERAAILNKIKSLVSLPDKHYEALVVQLFHNYASYIQKIPATENHHHAFPGGLLTHSLEVVLMSLLIRRGFMLPIGAPPEVLAKKQEIWSYAVLSAALLKHIGIAAIQQSITLFDDNKKNVGVWNPLKESLSQYPYYDIAFKAKSEAALGAKMTPLIAQKIMPKEGLLWLSSDNEIMTQWISVLMSDMAGASILGQMVDRATKENMIKHGPKTPPPGMQGNPQQPPQPIQTPSQPSSQPTAKTASAPTQLSRPATPSADAHQPNSVPAASQGKEGQITTRVEPEAAVAQNFMTNDGSPQMAPNFSPQNEQTGEADATMTNPEGNMSMMNPADIPSDLGEYFMYWLKQALAHDKLAMNQEKAELYVVKKGLLLVAPTLFHRFVMENPELETDVDAVQKRFIKLKLHSKQNNQNISSYASYASGKRLVVRGYLIADPSTLVDPEKLPEADKHLEEDFI